MSSQKVWEDTLKKRGISYTIKDTGWGDMLTIEHDNKKLELFFSSQDIERGERLLSITLNGNRIHELQDGGYFDPRDDPRL